MAVNELLKLPKRTSEAAVFSVNVATPVTFIAPLWEICPLEATDKAPAIVEVSITVALLLVKLTPLADALFKATLPDNTLACVKVMPPVVAVKLLLPGTVNTPVCVMAPLELTARLPAMVEVARMVALLLVRLTALTELSFKVTAPVKTFAEFKVIAPEVVEKLLVPGTVNKPDCVIAPPTLIFKAPVSVNAGKLTAPEFGREIVKLFIPVGKEGSAAPAAIFVKDKLLILELLVKAGPVLKVLLKLPSKISEPAVFWVKVAKPVTLMAAD